MFDPAARALHTGSMSALDHLDTLPAGPFRFIAIDVETADQSIGSICQIGLCCVDDAGGTHTYSTLVDPEGPFAPFNTELHGICARKTRGAPNFATAFAAMRPLLAAHKLVQHSTFDEKAFTAACARYAVPMVTSHWTNSVTVARQAWPEFKGAGGHGLGHLKTALGLVFRHHDAGEDARAAAEVILHAEARRGARLAHLQAERQLAFAF